VVKVDEESLSAITAAILHKVDAERVVLFGSQVRVTATVDSDIDLLVIDRRPFSASRSRRKMIAELRSNLPKLGIPIDVLLFSVDEMNQWRDSTNHVIASALREGRTIYG
jgi:uncharacterized protein